MGFRPPKTAGRISVFIHLQIVIELIFHLADTKLHKQVRFIDGENTIDRFDRFSDRKDNVWVEPEKTTCEKNRRSNTQYCKEGDTLGSQKGDASGG